MSESFTLDTEKVDPPKVDAPSPSPSFNEISTPRLIIFVMLMAISQIFTQAALAQTVVPLKFVSKSFDVESSGELSWFTASYSLTVGTFILIAGQLGDLFGYKKLYLIGYTIFGLFSLICGFATFSHSAIFFDVMRALQGLGLAIAVPNSLGLIGGYFPHGSHSKNIALSLFGGVAPMGFLIGAVFSSLIAQFSWWPWYFWITGIASCIVLILGYIFIPKGIRGQDDKGSWKDFDYFGSLFGVTGLVLFNFAWNQGPVVGWETPYVYILLIIGILAIVGFFYVELKVSKRPLVPREVLTGDTGFVLACIISGWSCFGIWIYYQFQFSEFILHQSPLLSTAQMVPTMFAGLIAGISTTYMLKYFSTSVVMTISLCCFLIGSCLMGTRPVTQMYWAQKFPSAILTPFGMDISFPAATIVLSHHLKKEHQGVAASVVATCVNYSISIGLGIAGTVQRYVDPQDLKTLEGMRAAFYTGIGLAGLGVVVGLAFIIKQRALTV